MPPCPVKKAHFIKPSDMQRTAVHFQNRRLATAYAILAQQSDCQNCGFFYLSHGSMFLNIKTFQLLINNPPDL